MPLDPAALAAAHAKLEQLRRQIDADIEALVSDLTARKAAEHDGANMPAPTQSHAETPTAINEAIARARAEMERLIGARAGDATAGAEREQERLEGREEAEWAFATELAATRAEAARALAEELAAADVRAARAVADAVAATEAEAAEMLAETEARRAHELAAAVAAAEQKAARTLSESLAAARAKADADLAISLAEARADERRCELGCLDGILQTVRRLGGAISLTQVLDRLADGAAQMAVGRIALLVVGDHVLRGWRLFGFGEQDERADQVIVPLDRPTVASRAVVTGEPATTRDGAEAAPLVFAPLPDDRVGLALPLRVGGRTVAVLYADDLGAAEPNVPSGWPEALEILTRHASRSLELLTISRACGALEERGREPAPASHAGITPEQGESAQRYARLLLSEIKLYHEDAVNAGRRDANLLQRLGPEIQRARRAYEDRVPPVVRAHADYFGQELVRTLANGDPRLLGQAT